MTDLGMEQERRVARAFAEEMIWTKAPNGWVANTASGGTYLVTEKGTCTCGDYQWRCAGTLLRCKHGVQLAHHLLETGGKLGPEDRVVCNGCGEILAQRQTKVQPNGERLCRCCEPVAEEVDLAKAIAKEDALRRVFDEF
jgi:hypothetical protein